VRPEQEFAVSSIKERLITAFERLKYLSVPVAEYEDEAQDAAFDITTTDTFVAGIADTILRGKTVSAEHRPVVAHPFLRGDGFWLCADAPAFDLNPFPELLEYATAIERVRKLCADDLRGG
jgi:hypothetical protein